MPVCLLSHSPSFLNGKEARNDGLEDETEFKWSALPPHKILPGAHQPLVHNPCLLTLVLLNAILAQVVTTRPAAAASGLYGSGLSDQVAMQLAAERCLSAAMFQAAVTRFSVFIACILEC